jgi:PAS domain S-box-containing protein
MGSADRTKEKTGELAALRRCGVEVERLKAGRNRAEEGIKQAAKEWGATFDSITDLVSIQDRYFRLKRVNRAFIDFFKMRPEEFIGKPCYEIFHGTSEPLTNCPLNVTIETKEPVTEEFFEPHLGVYLEVYTSPIFNEQEEVVACVHVARDITERKRMEENLIITDRLASIGELVSGVAHELNNPLTSVIGFLELLLGKNIPSYMREELAIIHHEAMRAAEVVSKLLTFARKHTPLKQLANINSIIATVLGLRAYELKVRNIQVKTRFASDLPTIMADNFQLQQVFLNIIINAEYFMIKAHNRGTLTITTEKVRDIVRISFADDGPGIPKENLGHIFDPFFTTKEVGQGTGLGLSICHGMVAEHSGRIYAVSELGNGATFIVELPITNNNTRRQLNGKPW